MRAFRRHPVLTLFAPFTLALPLGCGTALASDWKASVAASSNHVVHGLTRSRNEAVVQGHLGWTNDRRWAVGVWASTVDLHSGAYPHQEYDFYVNRSWPLGRDWRVSAQLARYEFRGDPANFSYDYSELAASLSYRDTLAVSLSVSPDYSSYSLRGAAYERTAIGYEASARLPVNRFLQVTSGVGHRDLSDLFGASYWYWNAGVEMAVSRLTLGVSYIGTNGATERLYGEELAANTWMATVAMRVH